MYQAPNSDALNSPSVPDAKYLPSQMDLESFLNLYAPLNLVTYDRENSLLVAHDADHEPFIMLVKVRPTLYVALTNYADPGVASNEFYIMQSAITHTLFEDYDRLEDMCAKAMDWAVRVKQALRTTDDYHTIAHAARRHPFLRAIYDQYFLDLDGAITIFAQLLTSILNYPMP